MPVRLLAHQDSTGKGYPKLSVPKYKAFIKFFRLCLAGALGFTAIISPFLKLSSVAFAHFPGIFLELGWVGSSFAECNLETLSDSNKET